MKKTLLSLIYLLVLNSDIILLDSRMSLKQTANSTRKSSIESSKKISIESTSEHPFESNRSRPSIVPDLRNPSCERDAYPGEFNEIVSLRLRSNISSHFGAGVILSPKWILTVRRNLINEPTWDETVMEWINFSTKNIVVYPAYKLSLETFTYFNRYFAPAKTFCHPLTIGKYPPIVTYTDIGLIKLNDPIHLDIPQYNFTSQNPGGPYWNEIPVHDHDDVTFAGWSRKGGPFLKVRRLYNAGCVKKSAGIRYHPNFHWCLNDGCRGVANICDGHQGGPAVLRNNIGLFRFIGISGFGTCCDCLGESYFMKMAPFIGWIRRVMMEEEQKFECSHLMDNQMAGSGKQPRN